MPRQEIENARENERPAERASVEATMPPRRWECTLAYIHVRCLWRHRPPPPVRSLSLVRRWGTADGRRLLRRLPNNGRSHELPQARRRFGHAHDCFFVMVRYVVLLCTQTYGHNDRRHISMDKPVAYTETRWFVHEKKVVRERWTNLVNNPWTKNS